MRNLSRGGSGRFSAGFQSAILHSTLVDRAGVPAFVVAACLDSSLELPPCLAVFAHAFSSRWTWEASFHSLATLSHAHYTLMLLLPLRSMLADARSANVFTGAVHSSISCWAYFAAALSRCFCTCVRQQVAVIVHHALFPRSFSHSCPFSAPLLVSLSYWT